MITQICKCGKQFKTFPSIIKKGKGKYCSKKCGYKNFQRRSGLKYNIKVKNKGWFKKEGKPWNKGKPMTKLISYKGENAKINTTHKWIYRWYGKATKCKKCDTTKNVQWSNKNEKYLRIKSDWQMLCIKCHQRYDYEKFKHRKKFYE